MLGTDPAIVRTGTPVLKQTRVVLPLSGSVVKKKSLAAGTQEARLCFPAHDPAATDRAASLSVTGAQMDPEAQKERKHFN